jgi:hypothetical protein
MTYANNRALRNFSSLMHRIGVFLGNLLMVWTTLFCFSQLHSLNMCRKFRCWTGVTQRELYGESVQCELIPQSFGVAKNKTKKCCVDTLNTRDVSEKYIASIFRL